MKKSVIMLLAAAAMLSFNSCEKVNGEGPVETQNRPITDFTGISTNIDGQVNFIQAPEYKVQLVAQGNILNIVETFKSGNDLIIKFKNHVNITNRTDVVINISAPTLKNVYVNGSGNFKSSGNLISPVLNTFISGSGNIRIENLQSDTSFNCNVSGSGYLQVLAGQGKNENLSISGSGNVDIASLNAESAIVKISGSGNAKLFASQNLQASISGSGNLYYLGNPAINAHVSGSGRIVRL